MNPTKIHWCDDAWNPIVAVHLTTGRVGHHCEKTSTGCERCYAEAVNLRFGNKLRYTASTTGLVEFRIDPARVEKVLRTRKKDRTVFVCSMTDLFQEGIGFDMVDRVVNVIKDRSDLDFVILTKRAERMRGYMHTRYSRVPTRPPLNLWLGVSVSTQTEADEKLPVLLDTPAAHRLVSIEPMLEWIHLPPKTVHALDWIIVGKETGPGARPIELTWISQPVVDGEEAGTPVFVKPPFLGKQDWPPALRCAKKEAAR